MSYNPAIDSEFAIVGGGVAGLAMAIGLQNIHRDFVLFEQASEVKGIGAGFGLAANAMRALELLGLREEVEKIGHHLHDYNILDNKGEVLVAPDTNALSSQYQQRNFAIHRADLHLYLLSKIEAKHLRLGRKAVRILQHDDSVTVYFDDNTRHTAKSLIIADGVKSPLRQQLVPNSAPRYSGYTCWRATIDNSEILLDKGTETWGKAGRFGMTPLVNGRIYWYACINAAANDNTYRHYTVSDLLAHFGHYHHPIPQVLAQTSDADLIWNDIIDIRPLDHLAYGNALLIGDAGHATTPNMGQGACQALEDVVVLLDELKKTKSTQAAFISFEKRRLKRTRYITDTSAFIGKVAQWENPALIFFRNKLLKALPTRISQQKLNKLLSVDFMQTGL